MSGGTVATVKESILKKTDNEKKQKLQPKLFSWDDMIFYLASAILGLSVSTIVVDFLMPESNAVVCFTSGNNRDHTAYINNFCHKDLPHEEYFTLALAIQGTLLLVPNYLWRVLFSARVNFFFNDAANLEKLRDKDTGKYPPQNFEIVDYLDRNFRETRSILWGYRIKLIVQLGIVVGAIITTALFFRNFTIQFHCFDEPLDPDNDTTFERVRCSYAKLRFISILRWIDYVFLGLSVLIILYGLYWCLPMKGHSELGYQEISQFCFDSCINSKHYVAEPNSYWYYILYHIAKICPIYCIVKKIWKEECRKWPFYHLENDLHFLLMSLFATDAGLGEVFKSIKIASSISQKLTTHLESLNSSDLAIPDMSFQKTMKEICEKLNDYQKQDLRMSVDYMGVLDIACGDHSYLFAIARCGQFEKIISIQLDPYYKNKNQIFTCDEYHAGKMIVMRIPTNLFGLPKEHKEGERNENPFKEKVYSYAKGQGSKFRLVVVGPLDSDRKKNTVNQIIKMDSQSTNYFTKGSILLVFVPLEVEGKQIYNFDWILKSEYWYEISSFDNLKKWLPQNRSERWYTSRGLNRGKISIKCGNQQCKFGVIVYSHRGYR